MRILLILFSFVFVLSACQNPADDPPSGDAKRYPIKGKVVAVNKDKKTATIDHEAVADYMPAMTMDFPIHDDWVWEDLAPGSEIRAELVVDNTAKDPYWLEKLAILAAVNANSSVAIDDRFAQIGREIPDFSLTNQDGKRIAAKDYRGKALAITFIYSECPLPDYCIKMSTAFSDLANELAKDQAAADKYRLLSISFDPARDTPEKLRSYGLGYLGKGAKPDFTIWQLAVGGEKDVRAIADFFGLRYEVDQNDKAQINHSLRTIVISPEGKVTKIFPGNEWTVADLRNELEKAAGSAAK